MSADSRQRSWKTCCMTPHPTDATPDALRTVVDTAVDTNVVVSAALLPERSPEKAFKRARERADHLAAIEARVGVTPWAKTPGRAVTLISPIAQPTRRLRARAQAVARTSSPGDRARARVLGRSSECSFLQGTRRDAQTRP